MTTHLSVLINDKTAEILDDAKSRGIDPGKLLEAGVDLLDLFESATEAYLIDPDGTRHRL